MSWIDGVGSHYAEQAKKHGLGASSTMEDQVIRAKELDAIAGALDYLLASTGPGATVLDLGCGNGFAISALAGSRPQTQFIGIDISEDMIELARDREQSNVRYTLGSALKLPDSLTGEVDFVYTERCLINILDAGQRLAALDQILRVLRPGGLYMMIEGFTDGLDMYNKARLELGMEEVSPPPHNEYFDKDEFFQYIAGKFIVKNDTGSDNGLHASVPVNFLSSHYFIRNVLHPLVTQGEWIRNTEFVKFFSFLPPVGNYAPIQAYVLEKA